MIRFFIEFKKNLLLFKADPKPLAAGIIAPSIIIIAFTLLFGGIAPFPLGIINYDKGPEGEKLIECFDKPINPLGGKNYFSLSFINEEKAEELLLNEKITGYLVIPEDFSRKLAEGNYPDVNYRFNNYNSDFGKNMRLYLEEVILEFHQLYLSNWQITMEEKYSSGIMVEWVDIIASGSILLAALIGGMFCYLYFFFKEKEGRTILFYKLTPLSSFRAFSARYILSLFMGIFCGTINMILANIMTGRNYFEFYPVFLIVFIFSVSAYIGLSSIISMMIKGFFGAAMGTMFSAILVWFISGGMTEFSPIRKSVTGIISAVFPNEFALRIIRGRIFHIYGWEKVTDLPYIIFLALLFLTIGAVLDHYKNYFPGFPFP
ncbi:MAG: ABC transporter permease [Spirochaetaceae bacterium]|jgi:ABC-2 type transport system permease protein|nr:ABC transporter permease [Spirochaetaceae bacterium]